MFTRRRGDGETRRATNQVAFGTINASVPQCLVLITMPTTVASRRSQPAA